MKKGSIKWFNDAKGYGFIVGSDGKDVFVHYTSIQADGFKTLIEGEEVEYEDEQTQRGLQAKVVYRSENRKF